MHNGGTLNRVLLLTMLVGLLAVGCTTSYQPMGYTGGYSEAEIEPNVFLLEYLGNAHTGLPTIVSYWHRRANELCKARNMGLTILDRKGGREIRGVSEGTAYAKPYYSGHIKCESEGVFPAADGIDVM